MSLLLPSVICALRPFKKRKICNNVSVCLPNITNISLVPPKGLQNLSDVFGPDSTSERFGFYVSLFLLEVGFTLPLLNFIRDVLYDFHATLSQLMRLSRWLLVGFFIMAREKGIYPSNWLFYYMFFLAGVE